MSPALISVFLLVLCLAGAGVAALTLSQSRMRETRRLRRENADLRDLVAAVQVLALDHMDVDPLARVVLDTIRTNLREITS